MIHFSASFRLWMTSEPSTTFPLNLIQNSVKITYEKPKGLKSSLLNSYQTGPLNSSFYDSCPKQDKLFKQMLYSLTFFDVVVNERKNYGHFGWNVTYEFNESDFTQSIRQLQTFLCDGQPIPFETLQYIISECFYGGRITDEYDKRLLKTILKDIFNDDILIGPPYRFTSIDACALPLRFEHRLILKFIEDTILEKSTCVIYGLHENSDFIHKLNTSNALLSNMETVLTRRNKIVHDESQFLEMLHEILEKLPKPVDTESANDSQFSNGISLNIILTTEMKMFNILLKTIRKSFSDLQFALQGLAIIFSFVNIDWKLKHFINFPGSAELTPQLENLNSSILANRIPEQWKNVSYLGGEFFSTYLDDFRARFEWIQNWWISNELPKTFWLSAFFHPRRFIEAIKLDFARENEIQLEEITIDVDVVHDTG